MQGGTSDLLEALRRRGDWWRLGWSDFLYRHRGTALGPFWQTAHAGLWALGLALIFSHSEASEQNYVAYVSVGVVFWNYMQMAVTTGATTFTRYASQILNIRTPLSMQVLRVMSQNLSRLIFQSLLCLAVLVAYPGLVNLNILWLIPAVVALIFTSAWVGLAFGVLGARFADVDHIVTASMRFLFFATPVFWVPGESSMRQALSLFNPFAHYLEVLRAPLLGQEPSLLSWSVVIVVSLVGGAATMVLFNRTRWYIPFWL